MAVLSTGNLQGGIVVVLYTMEDVWPLAPLGQWKVRKDWQKLKRSALKFLEATVIWWRLRRSKGHNQCTVSERSVFPQHAVSSVWQIHTVVLKQSLHYLTFSSLLHPSFRVSSIIRSLFPFQVQQSWATWQKSGERDGREVDVEGSEEDEEEETVEERREG